MLIKDGIGVKKLINKKNITNIICIIAALVIFLYYGKNYVTRSPKLALCELAMNLALITVCFAYSKSKTIYGAFRAMLLVLALVPLIPITWLGDLLRHSIREVSILEYFMAVVPGLWMILPALLLAIAATKYQGNKIGRVNAVLLVAAGAVLMVMFFVPKYVYVAEYLISALLVLAFSSMYEALRFEIASENMKDSTRIFYEVVEYFTFFIFFLRALHLYYAMIIY